MQEKEKPLIKHLHTKLCSLFQYTAFNNPEFLKGAIAKHFNIPVEKVNLQHIDTTEKHKIYKLSILECGFNLTFDKRVEEPKEIVVPKVVQKPKKWYQIKDTEYMVVKEKVLSTEKPFEYWVLNAIE